MVQVFIELKIIYRWIDHEPVYTVEESLKQIQDKEPIKNLLVKDKSGKLAKVMLYKNLFGISTLPNRFSFISYEGIKPTLSHSLRVWSSIILLYSDFLIK